jgi:hypothetical protein
MTAARGDQKPCVQALCAGTMQFGRSSTNNNGRDGGPLGSVRIATTADDPDPMGWICSRDAEHYQPAERPALHLVAKQAR